MYYTAKHAGENYLREKVLSLGLESGFMLDKSLKVAVSARLSKNASFLNKTIQSIKNNSEKGSSLGFINSRGRLQREATLRFGS